MPKLISVLGLICIIIGIIGVGVWFVTSNQASSFPNKTLTPAQDTHAIWITTISSIHVMMEANFQFNLQNLDNGRLIVAMYVIAENSFDINDVGDENLIYRWPEFDSGDNELQSIKSAIDLVGNLFVYFDYDGSSTITLSDMEAKFNWFLLAVIGLGALVIGIILGVISMSRGRAPKPVMRPVAQPLYEPSLGARASTFSTTTASSETAKGKKKARAASTCPYCGKTVDASLIYCPHCYSKMK
ncbi:MAG: hypothetical protein ACFFDT_09285 [Candidatus Hodarchaeota archaeon]